MTNISQSPKREIIKDFADEISTKKVLSSDPPMTINFRTEFVDKKQREIYRVPLEILRFRKDNGRIASDVSDYVATKGTLKEHDDGAQNALRQFLERKDPQKTDILEKNILQNSQLEPAIITCDGFLINGNRRKMVLEKLSEKYPEKDDFKHMKVVILPDENEEGGPPTLIEIEQLENRYQLQEAGKSEYYGFDRALAIRKKQELGLTLKDQVKDDPAHAGKNEKEIKKAISKLEEDYLKPLECVDRYLEQSGRPHQYLAVSEGPTDREGRWQAFVDFSASYEKDFKNPRKRNEMGVEEAEVGKIETAAYHIIRLRNIPEMPKVHKIMRDLPKYCKGKEGKKAILAIEKEVTSLSESECKNEDGSPLSSSRTEEKWKAKNQQNIIWHLKEADRSYRDKKTKETPLNLLDAALKKLNHDNMDLSDLAYRDYDQASKVARKIQTRADDIEGGIYEMKKKAKNLETKK